MFLREVVESHNPWWSDPQSRPAAALRVKRDLHDPLLKRLREPLERRAALLVGPRQVGKTTLLLQLAGTLLDDGLPPAQLLYIDFSDYRLADRVVRDPEAMTAVVPRGSGTAPRIFLLDEITQATGWDRWLKAKVDLLRRNDVPASILATDSAARLLRRGGEDSGQGRWDEIRIETLGYPEFSRLLPPGRDPFELYMQLGGFPEFVMADDFGESHRRLREDIVDKAVRRDLAAEVRRIEVLRRLFVYLVQHSGAIANSRKLGGVLGVDHRTIGAWLDLLEQTALVVRLPRHAGRESSRLRGKPKLYALDHALVHAMSTLPADASERRGRVAETAVFRHLRELTGGLGVSYHRPTEQAEIDFVVEGERQVAVQVTASLKPDGKKLKRLNRSTLETAAKIFITGGADEGRVDSVAVLPLRRFLQLETLDQLLEVGR